MRQLAAVLALLLLPASAAARELRLIVGETSTIPFPGATAAFAVDPGIVEATARGGELVLIGRRAGQSPVTVVTVSETETLTVLVTAPERKEGPEASTRARSGGILEGSYDSATGRYTTSLGMHVEDGDRSARLRLFGVSQSGDHGGEPVRALPSASLELRAPGRSIVLLDELVHASPLTLDDILLRGLHLQNGGWDLHAGVASATPWNDLLIPSNGERALGVSYRRAQSGFHLIPSLLWLPDAETAVPGVVSLGIERGAAGDPFRGRAELGWSDRPGGALDLALDTPRQRAWLVGQYRPEGFAALDVAKPPGTFLDGAWSRAFGDRITADLTVSASRLAITGQRQQASSERFELGYRAAERWTLTAGVNGGTYQNLEADRGTLRRTAGSFGASYDGLKVGVSTLYRYQEISDASHGGHGGRLTLRAGSGHWQGHLFVDAQQDAPTVDLVLQSQPGLERVLAELGLAADSPEELVRLLRDNAALFAAHGVQIGALELNPLRVNGGLDVTWRGSGPARPQVGLRVVVDDSRAISHQRATYLATLSASRRIFGNTDLILGVSRWATTLDGSRGDDRGSVEVALRTQIPDLKSLPGFGRAIRGTIRRDDRAPGYTQLGGLPIGGVEVVLDGKRRTQSDSKGRFTFEPVDGGSHRVQVVLPDGAYFTTPSALTASAGQEVSFGLAFSTARLSGHVCADSGRPIPGVTVRLEGGINATATTDSKGAFVFAAAGGEARLSIVPDSLPPGFDLAALRPETVRLQVGAPLHRDLLAHAYRSIAGTVRARRPRETTVTVEGLDRTVTPAADGRFVLRGLPAGRLTLVAQAEDGEDRRTIEIPPEPGILEGVVLAPGAAAGAEAQATRPKR
jgi:hypothetical protein